MQILPDQSEVKFGKSLHWLKDNDLMDGMQKIGKNGEEEIWLGKNWGGGVKKYIKFSTPLSKSQCVQETLCDLKNSCLY